MFHQVFVLALVVATSAFGTPKITTSAFGMPEIAATAFWMPEFAPSEMGMFPPIQRRKGKGNGKGNGGGEFTELETIVGALEDIFSSADGDLNAELIAPTGEVLGVGEVIDFIAQAMINLNAQSVQEPYELFFLSFDTIASRDVIVQAVNNAIADAVASSGDIEELLMTEIERAIFVGENSLQVFFRGLFEDGAETELFDTLLQSQEDPDASPENKATSRAEELSNILVDPGSSDGPLKSLNDPYQAAQGFFFGFLYNLDLVPDANRPTFENGFVQLNSLVREAFEGVRRDARGSQFEIGKGRRLL
jgi:hypothetical protein